MTAGASNADATSFLTFANGPTLNQSQIGFELRVSRDD
jgi:hypothetical protein